jgi:hypothetical protein
MMGTNGARDPQPNQGEHKSYLATAGPAACLRQAGQDQTRQPDKLKEHDERLNKKPLASGCQVHTGSFLGHCLEGAIRVYQRPTMALVATETLGRLRTLWAKRRPAGRRPGIRGISRANLEKKRPATHFFPVASGVFYSPSLKI